MKQWGNEQGRVGGVFYNRIRLILWARIMIWATMLGMIPTSVTAQGTTFAPDKNLNPWTNAAGAPDPAPLLNLSNQMNQVVPGQPVFAP